MGVDGLLGLFSQFHNIVFICKLFFFWRCFIIKWLWWHDRVAAKCTILWLCIIFFLTCTGRNKSSELLLCDTELRGMSSEVTEKQCLRICSLRRSSISFFKYIPLKALFGCACIHLNPHVLERIGMLQHMWIEVDTHTSKQGLNVLMHWWCPLQISKERHN
jgi:hypothetical protein